MKKNIKKKLIVAVLFGGKSMEHEISLCSAINIIKKIDKKKYDLVLIGIDKDGRWLLFDKKDYLFNSNDPSSINLPLSKNYLTIFPGFSNKQFFDINNKLMLPKIDIVFPTLHGTYGEDGSMQGLLNIINIPYVGTGVLGSALCIDKDISKRILSKYGIKITKTIVLNKFNYKYLNFKSLIKRIGLPMFIKPSNQGSSIGVSKVSNYKQFKQALSLAFNFDSKILIEKNVVGREIEIAILEDKEIKLSVCGEIITSNNFYNYENKYLKSSQTKIIIPAILDNTLVNKIKEISKKIFTILNCKVMARVDFFVTKDNQIIFNEINTLPGFTSTSMYPKLWEASGLNCTSLISCIINSSIKKINNATLNNK